MKTDFQELKGKNVFTKIARPGMQDGCMCTFHLIYMASHIPKQLDKLDIQEPDRIEDKFSIHHIKKMVTLENPRLIKELLKAKVVPKEIEKKILSYCKCFYCKKPTLKTGKAAGAGGIAIVDTEFVCEECQQL